MALEVNAVELAAGDPAAAAGFYAALFDTGGVTPVTDGTIGSGFGGAVLGAVVPHAGDVRAVIDSARAAGATVLKEPKKRLFGEYAGVFRAPDGALWKITAGSRKDRGGATLPVRPTETAVYLGVASPKASKKFYEALGMRAEHDYGNTFVGFHHAEGAPRLGLMTRAALAKDAAVDPAGSGPSGVVPVYAADGRTDADRLLAAVAAAGGTVGTGDGFTDPDGQPWRIAVC